MAVHSREKKNYQRLRIDFAIPTTTGTVFLLLCANDLFLKSRFERRRAPLALPGWPKRGIENRDSPPVLASASTELRVLSQQAAPTVSFLSRVFFLLSELCPGHRSPPRTRLRLDDGGFGSV